MTDMEFIFLLLICVLLLIVVGMLAHINQLGQDLREARRNDNRDPVTGRFVSVKKKGRQACSRH